MKTIKYVPPAELRKQYQELADNSTSAILSLTKQRQELRELIKRWVEIGPELIDIEEWSQIYGFMNAQSDELKKLLSDCKEILE